jgi:hypothetical protein
MPIVRNGTVAVITTPDWLTHIITKYQLQTYYLKPILPPKTAQNWRAKYVEDADPTYKTAKIVHAITDSAIGWHEDGELLFLFLKGAIPQDVQSTALSGLQKMDFVECSDSKRPELKGAIEFNARSGQADPVIAGELNVGFGARSYVYELKDTEANREALKLLTPILDAMAGVFQRLVPKEFSLVNSEMQAKAADPVNGRAIPVEFRLGGTSPFSSAALLRSAPSAVHTDGRNGSKLACMTSVAPGAYTGGKFCFVDYGVTIGVRPGDVLIATTPRDWHCNLEPVVGEKYSVVAYFKKVIAHPRLLAEYRACPENPGGRRKREK